MGTRANPAGKLPAVFALGVLLSACAPGASKPPVASAAPVVFNPVPALDVRSLPGWDGESKAAVVAAFAAGCPNLDQSFANACAAARAAKPGSDSAAGYVLESYFRAEYLGATHVTGYFELTLAGSRTPDARFRFPVLRPPADPRLYSRNEIMSGILSTQGLELVWLQSEADLYFLQLQGSGRVILPDNTMIRVGTAANNGHPRTPPSSLFGGAPIPGHDLSIPGIRAWAAAHPDDAHTRMERDQAYVFFRTTPDIPPQYGPYGSFGLPLLPLRSVAISPSTAPLGTFLWLQATNTSDNTRLPHLVLAHDTGELISGQAQLDMFYGWGAQAEQDGGHENSQGALWALLPR